MATRVETATETAPDMNGAESLTRSLVESDVTVCFANPGTSEMHFVAALDRVDEMRCVLCLFEGVATGAADGYGRMLGRPAATLLHLGPGLGNGLANLHNAKKAATPIVNIVGDHATYHRDYNAPLTSDIETAARPFSHWVKTSKDSQSVGHDGATAVAEAMRAPGQIATLILPADTAWGPGSGVARPVEAVAPARVGEDNVATCARALRSGKKAVVLLGGNAVHERELEISARICARTGATLMADYHNSRMQIGAGRVAFERVPYPVDQAVAALAGFDVFILVGTTMPVAFFAYPGKPSLLAPERAQPAVLAAPNDDCLDALERLSSELSADGAKVVLEQRIVQPIEGGAITGTKLGTALAALMPENAIVVDESASTGRNFVGQARNGPPVDWLNVKGGSIGFGLPAALGAALACPNRRVVCLESDGSGLYTAQALWSYAREGLNVTVVVLVNRTYGTLVGELKNVGVENVGRKARDMFELQRPDIAWTDLAKSFAVPAVCVRTMEEFTDAFRRSVNQDGPSLIEAILG